jgi:hypothetical protein
LAVCLLGAALFITASLAAAPAARHVNYLPVLMDNFQGSGDGAKGISGKVTDGMKAAPGVKLDLRRYDAGGEITVQSTTTNGQGAYLFSGVPALGAGQTYYVRYGPNSDTGSNRVAYWFGPDIVSYGSGTAAAGGSFDIIDAPLKKPVPGATVALPATFSWGRRGITGDTFRLVLHDHASDKVWYTDDLGDVDHVIVPNLPAEIVYGRTYGWNIRIFNGPDSYGVSQWYYHVIFSAGAAQDSGATPLRWQVGDGHSRP